MAATNLIHRFESEVHAMRANLRAQGDRASTTRWMIGRGFTGLAVLVSVLGFLLS